jgi:hypothetical protein
MARPDDESGLRLTSGATCGDICSSISGGRATWKGGVALDDAEDAKVSSRTRRGRAACPASAWHSVQPYGVTTKAPFMLS